MAPSKAASPGVSLPEALRPLAAELAKLPEQDREMVISAARAANTTRHVYRTMSWRSLMSAKGVVTFGGNAVDHRDALYDGLRRRRCERAGRPVRRERFAFHTGHGSSRAPRFGGTRSVRA